MKKIRILGYSEEATRDKSHFAYYFAAFLASLFFITLVIIFLKGLAALHKLISFHWIWIISTIVIALLIRKILMRKKINVIQEYPQ